MDLPTPDEEDLGAPASIGITDIDSGVRVARETFRTFRRSLIGVVDGGLSSVTMGLLALVTRAQGFHDGALLGVEARNPYATFPLIRCYAENAAALLWMLNHPQDLKRLAATAPRDEKFAIGKLVAEASKHAAGFKGIYEQLSEFAHPVASRFSQPFWIDPEGDGTKFIWASEPRFKHDDDAIWACFWLVEITEIHANLWPIVYEAAVRRATH